QVFTYDVARNTLPQPAARSLHVERRIDGRTVRSPEEGIALASEAQGRPATMLKWPDVLKLAKDGNPPPDRKVVKSETEWRNQLSPEQYRVTRQAGTELAFSSDMCAAFEPGIYSCVCCDTVLFDASNKFESGTGWPSFTQPIAANVIAYHADGTFGMRRVETV